MRCLFFSVCNLQSLLLPSFASRLTSSPGKGFPLVPWLLNLIYALLLIAVSPWLAFRAATQGKYRAGWREKLGGLVPERKSDAPCIWLHAVSVGEALQLQPVLEMLAARCPGYEFVISTTTTTAFELATKKYSQHRVIYFPLDFTWSVRRALARIRPTEVVLVELELWPNFILAAVARDIPVMLINGRISERSFRGYSRIRPLISRLLQRMSVLAVQNETYAQRLRKLGADPARISVTGSIKFDRVETDRNNPRTTELRRAFGFVETDRIFIAGSTQAPEERLAIETYLALQTQHPDLRLVLVPRHQERFEEVARLVTDTFHLPLIRRSVAVTPSGRGWSASRSPGELDAATPGASLRSSPGHPLTQNATPSIRLLDTLGELAACWGLAEIAFVGGSLGSRGGQNMIEPSSYGAAVCFGPNTQNFRDVVDLLLQNDAAVVVADGTALQDQVDWCLTHPNEAAACGERARQLVQAQRGATAKTVDCIVSGIPARPSEETRAA